MAVGGPEEFLRMRPGNPMPALIVLVDVDAARRERLDRLLSEQGYLVATAPSFARAKELLDSVHPDLLITAVRLDAFNGLHLVIRTRRKQPLLPMILTDASLDPVLEAEARRQGATHVANPLENPETFLSRVRSALEQPAVGSVQTLPLVSHVRLQHDRSAHRKNPRHRAR